MNWLRAWLIELIREAVRLEMDMPCNRELVQVVSMGAPVMGVGTWNKDWGTPPAAAGVARVRAGIEPKPPADDFESLQREAIQQCEVEA